MSDELNLHHLRTRRLNKFKGICENFEKDRSYKVGISKGRISYKSQIETSTPGYRYVSTAVEKFEKEKQTVSRFKQIFLPALRKTAVYFYNKDNEDCDKLYSALRKLDDENEEFDFEETIRDYVQDLNEVDLDYPAIVNSGSLIVSENSYSNLLEKKNPEKIYLPDGNYRFTLKTKAGNSTISKKVERNCKADFSIEKSNDKNEKENSIDKSEEKDKPYKKGDKEGIKVNSSVFEEEKSSSEVKTENKEANEGPQTDESDRDDEQKTGLIEKVKELFDF